jgi:molecular chaperone GrpE
MFKKDHTGNKMGSDDIVVDTTADQKDIPTETSLDRSDNTLDDSVIAEENSVEIIKKLREKLKKCEAEKQEYLTGWQRAKADLINARKRDEEDRKNFVKYSNANLILEIIPVLQSFDMAIKNKEVWEKVEKNWRVGVEYIYSQLHKVLTDNGLEEIDPLNEKYDHNHHEAVSHEPVDDQKLDNVIIQVIQKGYSLNGKVLKAPRVKVGEFKKP